MQLTFPRFCGMALVNFARQVGDILDLKAIVIEDTTDGQAGFGKGEVKSPKFIFEAQDGATCEIVPAQGPDLNPLLSSRYVAAQLERNRQPAAAPKGAASASDDIWVDRDKNPQPQPQG